MLIIVGSGRCGTQSFAEFFDAPHEPNKDPIVQLASSYSHGWLTAEQCAKILAGWEWPPIFADFKHAELIPVTARMEPHPDYLWVTRNPADTVASMVAGNWYNPEDDAYPVGLFKVYKSNTDDDRPVEMTIYNTPGNRTRGDFVGDFTLDEWTSLGQVERCGWWWNWVNKSVMDYGMTVARGRVKLVRLEDAVTLGDELGVRLLDEPRSLPHLNRERVPKPVSGWEPFVEEMSKVLGY